MTDEEAMNRVQKDGDPRAFAALVERWEQPIQRLCARMTGDVTTGEDLKQETFARVFARRMTFEQRQARVSTWLWRIAINLCHDELRRRSARPVIVGDEDDISAELPDTLPSPDANAAQNEEAELLRRAVLRLPERYRSVVLLRHTEGLKLREIAAVLDLPEGTVASRLNQSLDLLARLLRPQLDLGKPSVTPFVSTTLLT
jgi:RNA polymerase sigma-70 factor, ECF subfamily